MVAVGCAWDPPGPAVPATLGEERGFTPIRSADLLPDRDEAGRFRVTTSSGRESDRPSSTTVTNEGWTFWIRGKNRTVLERGPGGELLLKEDESLNRDFRAVYDPPLLLLPPVLRENVKAEGESHVTVYDLETGEEKTSGSIRYELIHVRQGPVRIDDEEHEGYTLRQTRRMDFPLFNVDMTIEIGMVPGVGVASDKIWQRVTAALGLYKQETYYHSERIE